MKVGFWFRRAEERKLIDSVLPEAEIVRSFSLGV
jgi:hypothetical protein